MFTRAAWFDDVSSVQISKSCSNAIKRPSYEIDGQSTRPLRNVVSCFAAAVDPGVFTQTFCAPPRSETKYRDFQSADHIGHISFAPPVVTASYFGGAPSRTNQTSAS